jgi:glycosyltransferase involved in cell wall biosynthesis
MGRSIRPGTAGIGRYSANLVMNMAALLPPGQLWVFLPRDAQRRWGSQVRELRAPFPTPSVYLRALWEQTVVPAQAAAFGLDLYHSPNFVLPLGLGCPAVVTVHDLFYLERSLHRRRNQLYLSVMTKLALQRATAIVAASEYTRRAVEARYPETAGRVEVVYVGVDRALRRPSAAEVTAFRARVGLEGKYVLSVGTLEPRKNLVRLIAAFERMVEEGAVEHRLVLVGALGWKTEGLEQALEGSRWRERIHCLGHVSDEELACWYAGAEVFVYPSLKEGFGVPPLEAMTLGTPVVTSNSTSLPEVVGEAALQVDPYDVEGLAAAMLRVVRDESLAEQLRSAGLERARRFDWQETARRHIAIYERVLSPRPPPRERARVRELHLGDAKRVLRDR